MPMSALPLSHLSVLDLTAHRAGPTAVRQLADWGAKVIKIEPPSDGKVDSMGAGRHDFDFQNLHRNKESMTLNLKSAQGHAIFMQLAAKADVIVENYRADVKHRLKVDYDTVAAINPRIVYVPSRALARTDRTRRAPASIRLRKGWAA
jgi:formyl-CoA transferase